MQPIQIGTDFSLNNFGYNRILGINANSPSTTTTIQQDINFSRYLSFEKENIKRALTSKNISQLIDYSNSFIRLSGRYKRLIEANATLYRYDYYVTPVLNENAKNKKKIKTEFLEVLAFLEKFNPKEKFTSIGRNILKNGSYYAYKIYDENFNLFLQELPVKYCTSGFKENGKDVIMLDISYFAIEFNGYTQDMVERIVNTFPKEIRIGWNKYKAGKVKAFNFNDRYGYWVALDSSKTIKFSFDDDLIPYLIQVIIPIIGLEETIALTRKRFSNSLKGILINKFPLKKTSDQPIASSTDMRNFNMILNAELSQRADDIISFSTLADTELLKNDTKSTTNEGKELVENAINEIYDEAGISQMQFNSDNSTALKYSINNDEASMSTLVELFEIFLNEIVEDYIKLINSKTKVQYKVEILRTTCHNYIELSKAYKEQVQLGFTKVLPQVALGQSQLSILNTLDFENEILELSNKLIPPAMSSTMSGVPQIQEGEKTSGRPESDNPEEKTLMNKESQSNN